MHEDTPYPLLVTSELERAPLLVTRARYTPVHWPRKRPAFWYEDSLFMLRKTPGRVLIEVAQCWSNGRDGLNICGIFGGVPIRVGGLHLTSCVLRERMTTRQLRRKVEALLKPFLLFVSAPPLSTPKAANAFLRHLRQLERVL